MALPARLVCIPSADTAFAEEARRVAARLPAGMNAGDALRWYSVALRRVFATAVVREQDELARMDAAEPVWYVTRTEHHFRIDTSLWVPLAPDAAFELYAGRMADWQTVVQLAPRRLLPGIVGSEYTATYSFLGNRIEGLFRILAAEPGRFLSVEAAGAGIAVWYMTTFRPERTGTHVQIKGDYELPDNLLARIVDRLGLERAIASDVERANESYRGLCLREASSAAATTAASAASPAVAGS